MHKLFNTAIVLIAMALCAVLPSYAAATATINDETIDHWTFASVTPAEGTVTSLETIKLGYPADMRGTGLVECDCDLTLSCNDGTSQVLRFSENAAATALVCTLPDGGITTPGTYTLTVPRDLLTSLSGEYDHNEAATYTWTIQGTVEGLTVTNLAASADEGVVLTFSEPVTVTHSTFGVKCYSAFNDLDGEISTLNAQPIVDGNVVTLTAQYCTFVNGHRIHLELNPDCFRTLDGETTLSGQVIFDFVMGDGIEDGAIRVAKLTPANGTRNTIANVTATFEPGLTELLDASGVTITNEAGNTLPLLRVELLDEGGVKALNVNVDTDNAQYQGGTTYRLHIAAGAIRCGEAANETEIVAGEWYIRPEMLTLVTTPAANRIVESLSSIIVVAEDEQLFDYIGTDASAITVTGIMEAEQTVYARATEVRVFGHGYNIILDKTLTPEVLTQAGAVDGNVKLNIPAGYFGQEGSLNDDMQVLWTIAEPVEMGEVTYTSDPEPGEVEALGTPTVVEDEDGKHTVYTITLRVSGDNVYAAIPDASLLAIVDETAGMPYMTFDKYDITTAGVNVFTLQLAEQITAPGDYTLVIPVEAINLYTDINHYSEPQHPETDIELIWTVKGTSGISAITNTARPVTYTLGGVRTPRTAPRGIYVEAGRKVVK